MQIQKKDKHISSLQSNLISNLTTIKTTQIEASSSGHYKIKPKLKAEVKVSWVHNHFGLIFVFILSNDTLLLISYL